MLRKYATLMTPDEVNGLVQASLVEATDRLVEPMRDAILQYPDHGGMRLAFGHYLYRLRKFDEAYEVLIDADTAHHHHKNPNLANLLGVVSKAQGKFSRAIKHFDEALSINEDYVAARFNRANAIRDSRGPEAAAEEYKLLIRRDKSYVDAYINLVDCLLKCNELEESKYYAQKFVAVGSTDWRSHFLLGNSLRAMNDAKSAIGCYKEALRIGASSAELYNNTAACLAELGQAQEAEAYYNKAVQISSGNWQYLFNRGSFYLQARRYTHAEHDLKKALAFSPEQPTILNAMARLNYELDETDAAIRLFNKALAIEPNHIQALSNIGLCYRDTGQLEMAEPVFRKILDLNPHQPLILGHLLFNQLRACAWSDYEPLIQNLAETLNQGVTSSTPFITVIALDDPQAQRRASELYFKKELEKFILNDDQNAKLLNKREVGEKIKVAYFSADFHDHATAYLITEVFERHNPRQFETFAFSFGKPEGHRMRERLYQAFTHFIDVSEKSDDELVQLARHHRLDIAVDLKGYTKGARPTLFAKGLAPIQINFLGFPGTLGNRNIHYLIADSTVIPEQARAHYTEQVLYLEPCYQPNDSKRLAPPKAKTRAHHGLPESAFILCSFNNSYKFTPDVFKVWLDAMSSRPNTVLWLLSDNEYAQKNLATFALQRGLDAKRIIFAPRASIEEHLERHYHADLFVDTYPCSAHTTASDCLWMGLPLLTLQGESMASRVASSLLITLGLNDLVTTSLKSYKKKLLDLIDNPNLIEQYKRTLRTPERRQILFSGEDYCRKLEEIYKDLLLDKKRTV